MAEFCFSLLCCACVDCWRRTKFKMPHWCHLPSSGWLLSTWKLLFSINSSYPAFPLTGSSVLLMACLKRIHFSLAKAWHLVLGPFNPQRNSRVLLPLISRSRFPCLECCSVQSAHIRLIKGDLKLFMAREGLGLLSILSPLSRWILTKGTHLINLLTCNLKASSWAMS